MCCISFDSYIKPQRRLFMRLAYLVVYLLIPTSNHNYASAVPVKEGLYIFWFLHQTTTLSVVHLLNVSCISFDSYIKPQPMLLVVWCVTVVYLLIPTSNHNWGLIIIQPSWVVYLLIPTSNHNWCGRVSWWFELYIFWFLHQTTTHFKTSLSNFGCISFDSYIKPQLLYQLSVIL